MRPSIITATALIVVVTSPRGVIAQTTYQVQSGDTLSTIARAHGVDTDDLQRLNKLADADHVEIGQTLKLPSSEGRVVDEGVLHTVERGVTLRRIARAYKIGLSRLIRANRIKNPDLLRRGMEILIPGATEVVPIATKRREPCLSEPVEIYRVHTRETLEVVLTRCNGRIWDQGREEISQFLDRTRTQTAPLLDERLLRLINQVYDHFEERRIEVVSAYRPPTGERSGSRHGMAKALDFRVQGVSNARLRDYVRSLTDVGVGYYPNSTFVHLDVRDRRAFWVDWSGPGEEPRYGTMEGDPLELRSEATRPWRRVRGATTPRPSTSAAP